ncbi:MAG: acetate--CoA ligase [Dehalococcoidia bacterium]|nr:acetate--CoA ligase [Dehalococcoidia bacterium]
MEVINPMVKSLVRRAREDPEAFWAEAASHIPWFRKWDTVFEWTPPTFRWFIGGQTNLCYSCLDRHVEQGRGGHAALIAIDERGERKVYTYTHLLNDVKRAAAALRGLGIGKGDRIAVYMPTCPEAITIMLAAARIGAIHVVVFAGFGASALVDRVGRTGCRLLFTADGTWRKGNDVPLKKIVDDAVNEGAGVERVVVLKHTGLDVSFDPERDLWWDDFLALGEGRDDGYEIMEANEPAYILPTSGTTARPKLAVHTHGGYQAHVSSMSRWVFGLNESDVWWATSDIGWVVGHAYIVHGPLLAGATTVAYEGAPDHPGPEAFYRVIQDNGITGMFTSPTLVRLMMRYGSEVARRFDMSRLQRVFSAGEVLNAPAWEWFQKEVFDDRIPVIDHMWATETSGPIIGNPYGVCMLPIKPGSGGIPLPGIEADVVTPEGVPCAPGEKGLFVIRRPFPGLTSQLWGEPERYGPDYWGRIPGLNVYSTGDAASKDEDGYIWFSGRADEVIKVAAHRIGTIEVETAFLQHPAVAEVGVTGRPDELRGEAISAFVVLKQGHQPSEELRRELLQTVRKELGPVAVIGEMNFVDMLPKTRSGKIMRRVLKAVVLGREPGDISTIEDEGSVEEAREAWRQMTALVGQEAKEEKA